MRQRQLHCDHGVVCSRGDGPQVGSQAETQSNPVESVIRVTLLGLFDTFVCGCEGSHYSSRITHMAKAAVLYSYSLFEQEVTNQICVLLFVKHCETQLLI